MVNSPNTNIPQMDLVEKKHTRDQRKFQRNTSYPVLKPINKHYYFYE